MKICWDNLNKFKYDSIRDVFIEKVKIGTVHWVYLESCPECGEPFFARKSSLKKGKGKFCSKSCSKKGGRSYFFNRKCLRKTSYIGKLNPMYGKNHTKDSRKKMSEAQSDGRNKMENNGRWKGGISRLSSGVRDPKYDRLMVKLWRKNNPEKVKLQWANKRVLKRCQKPGDFDRDRVNNIYRLCQKLNTGAGRIAFHVDHTIPLSKGGRHHQDNLKIVPAKFNLAKGSKVGDKWGNA